MDTNGVYSNIDDEDVPLLCPTHFRAYIGDMGAPLDDLMAFRSVPADPLDVAMCDFSPRTSSRARSPLVICELDGADAIDAIDDGAAAIEAVENDAAPLLAQLMESNVVTHDDAIALLRKHDLPVAYELVREREEFTPAELRFLCFVGALYHTRYRVQKRAREVCSTMRFDIQ